MSGNAQRDGRPHSQLCAPAAIYVHVPFCRSKCGYCDFYSVPVEQDLATSYVQAAKRELAKTQEHLSLPLQSVFIGGGTPTVLGPKLLEELLLTFQPLLDRCSEFTVEANPCSTDRQVAQVLRDCGVTRVSLGAQSFVAHELRLLGRTHTVQQIARAVAALKAAGIEAVCLDLIYSIPTQTLDSWRRSLGEALELPIQHMSCYALSFETGTQLERDRLAGLVAAMEESLQRECYFTAIETAEASGMQHYEISNFALPGHQCRHNLTYWHNEAYLGIGPAAASYIGGVRRTNRPDLHAYARSLANDRMPEATSEHLKGRKAMAESIMLGLRLTQGISRQEFSCRFGVDPVDAFGGAMRRHAEGKLLVITPSELRLAKRGLFLADTVLADILAEA